MSNAKHVGRVGGLAVALGVGLAVAANPAVACADDAANSGTGHTNSSNAHKNGTKTDKPKPKPPSRKPNGNNPTDAAADVTKRQAAAMTAADNTPKPSRTVRPSGPPHPPPRAITAALTDTTTPGPSRSEADSATVVHLTASTAALPNAIRPVSATMVGTSLLPAATGNPSAPNYSPVELTLAAWGTRPRDIATSKPPSAASTGQPLAATKAIPVAATDVYAPGLALSTSIGLGANPSAEVISPDGRLYVANTGSNSVSVINTITGKRIDANPSWSSSDIPVGATPGALALSPDGSRLYVANAGAGTVSVINTTGYKRIDANPSASSKDIAVGASPSALAVGVDGRLYVANKGSNTVSVIDPTTFSVTNTITVGNQPTALALDSTGRLFVANKGSNTVSVIDPTTFSVTNTITVGNQPTALALSPGGRLYVANAGDATLSVIDTVTNALGANPIAVGPAPSSVALKTDGSVAYVANSNDTITVINTATSAVVSTVAFDTDASGAHAVAVAPSGAVYVTDATDRVVRVLTPPALVATKVTKLGTVNLTNTGAPVLNADGTRALVITSPPFYVTTGSTRVAVINTATGKQVGTTVILPATSATWTMSADGTRALITTLNAGSPSVSVIDLVTGKQLTTLHPGGADLQLTPNGRRALLSSSSNGSTQVAVLDTTTGAQVGTFTLGGNRMDGPTLSADGSHALITTVTGDATTGFTTHAAVIDTTTGTQIGTTHALAGVSTYIAVPGRNADGNRAVIATRTGDETTGYTTQAVVIDTTTGTQIGTTQTLPGDSSPYAPLLNTDGSRALIATRTGDATSGFTTHVEIIDTTTGTQIGTTATVAMDGQVSLSSDQSRALITATTTDPVTTATTTALTTVELATGTQTGVISMPGAWRPELVNADGSRALAVTTNYAGPTQISVFNTLTGSQIGTTLTFTGGEFGSRMVGTDGNHALIVTNDYDGRTSTNYARFATIDMTTGAQIGSTTTLIGNLNGSVLFNPDTQRAVILTISSNFNTTGVATSQVAVINTLTGTQVGNTVTINPDNAQLVLNAGGTRAVVSSSKQHVVINTVTGTPIPGSVSGSWGNLLLTADGSRAVTSTVTLQLFVGYTTHVSVFKVA